MCYEKRDEELAKVCKERDELKKIVSKQHDIIERLMAELRERDCVEDDVDG